PPGAGRSPSLPQEESSPAERSSLARALPAVLARGWVPARGGLQVPPLGQPLLLAPPRGGCGYDPNPGKQESRRPPGRTAGRRAGARPDPCGAEVPECRASPPAVPLLPQQSQRPNGS